MEVATRVVDTLASGIEYFKPEDAHIKHFYTSPQHHVVEASACIGISFLLMFLSTIVKKPKINDFKKQNPPLNYSEYTLRFILTVNLILQLFYKAARGYRVLSYMLQPCHAASALYLYTLYTNNHRRATRIFNISLHYMFFTALAIAVPDLSQLHLPFEVSNFWIQHYVLLFVPVYILFSGRFPLTPSASNSLFAIGVGLLFHYICQLPAAFVTGVNVNYMLWPPPGIPPFLSTSMYRVNLAACFIFLAWVTGYVLPKFVASRSQKEKTKTK